MITDAISVLSPRSNRPLVFKAYNCGAFTILESLCMIVTIAVIAILCLGIAKKREWGPFQKTTTNAALQK